MYFKRILILILLLGLNSCDSEKVDVKVGLTELPKAPDTGQLNFAFSIAGKGYMGFGALGAPPTGGGNNAWYEYTPSTDTWTAKTSLPALKRFKVLGFSTEKKGYVGGGYNHSTTINPVWYNDFWEYDPQTDTWTERKSLPVGVEDVPYSMIMNVNNRGFLLSKNKFWEYIPSSNSWESKEYLPFSVGYDNNFTLLRNTGDYALTSFSNVGYVVIENSIWEYNTLKNIWNKKQTIPFSLYFVKGNKGYFINDAYLWEYNIDTGESKKLFNIPVIDGMRYFGNVFIIDLQIYFTVDYRTYSAFFYKCYLT